MKQQHTQEKEAALVVAARQEAVVAFDAGAFEDFEGQGLENVTSADKAIPRLYLLQKGTPAADEDSDGYVKGAKVGMLWNSLTNELHDARNGVRILPVFMHKDIVERDPLNNKFVAIHPLNTPLLAQCTLNEKRVPIRNDNGNKMVETANHFVVVISASGEVSWGIISMASGAMSTSKKLIGLADAIRLPRKNGMGRYQPPSFSHVFVLKSVAKKDEKFTWMAWEVEVEGPVQDPDAFAFAAEFFKAIAEGRAKAAPEAAEVEKELKAEGDEPPF